LKNNLKKLSIAFVCMGFFSTNAFALDNKGPEPSGVQGLYLNTIQGQQSVQIYANGNMQAGINVGFELNDGWEFDSVEFKNADTGTELSGWSVSESDNGYPHEIDAVKSSDFIPSTTTRYLSTNNAISATVCVAVTVRKTDDKSVTSTSDNCSKNVDSGEQVYIDTVEPPINLPITSFDSVKIYDNGGGQKSKGIEVTAYTLNSRDGVKLKSLPNGDVMGYDRTPVYLSGDYLAQWGDGILYNIRDKNNKEHTANYAYIASSEVKSINFPRVNPEVILSQSVQAPTNGLYFLVLSYDDQLRLGVEKIDNTYYRSILNCEGVMEHKRWYNEKEVLGQSSANCEDYAPAGGRTSTIITVEDRYGNEFPLQITMNPDSATLSVPGF